MDLVTRPLTPADADAIDGIFTAVFGEPWEPEIRELEIRLIPWDRTYGVWDGDQLVATAADLDFSITVPGPVSVSCAAVTWVSVLSTHRRRGVLTEMMRRELEDIHARGQPLAALWASESVIYGRFGYGLATQRVEYLMKGRASPLLGRPDESVRVRLVDRDGALSGIRRVFDEVAAARPGMMPRSAEWWEMVLVETDQKKDGFTRQLFLLAEGPSGFEGYAMYRVKWNADGHIAANQFRLRELHSLTPAATDAMWRYLLSLDLVTEWKVSLRPLDDPLPWMLADPRRLQRDVLDGIWLRLVDLPAALATRGYSADGELSLEVSDGFCPWNQGNYLLTVNSGRGAATRTERQPELRLGASEMGAVYLGGVSFSVLAAAGRVQELSPGALRRADAMFTTPIAPWCSTFF